MSNPQDYPFPFLSHLRDPDPVAREQAVVSLGSLNDIREEGVLALASALFDESPAVRTRASWYLFQLEKKAAPAKAALLRSLTDELDLVRQYCVGALAYCSLTDRYAKQQLEERLEDRNEMVSINAAYALWMNYHDVAAALAVLRRGLLSSSMAVQSMSASSIAHLGTHATTALPDLYYLFGNPIEWHYPPVHSPSVSFSIFTLEINSLLNEVSATEAYDQFSRLKTAVLIAILSIDEDRGRIAALLRRLVQVPGNHLHDFATRELQRLAERHP